MYCAAAGQPQVPPKPLHSGQPLAASAVLARLTAGAEVLEHHECAPVDLHEVADWQVLSLALCWLCRCHKFCKSTAVVPRLHNLLCAFQLTGSSLSFLCSVGVLLIYTGACHAVQIQDDAGQAVDTVQLRQQLISAEADPNLATPAWVSNHAALIKCQLAGLERQVPALQGQLLVASVVLDHLRYRYAI